MKMLPWPGPFFANVMFGVNLRRSSKLVMFRAASAVPENAWIVIGTSWTLWSRRWAVTITSSRADDGAAEAAASAAQAEVMPPPPLRIAATAHDTMYLVFMIGLPRASPNRPYRRAAGCGALPLTGRIQSTQKKKIATYPRHALRGTTLGMPSEPSVKVKFQADEQSRILW